VVVLALIKFTALHQGVLNQIQIVHRQLGILAKHLYLLLKVLMRQSFLLSLVNHCSHFLENECTMMYAPKVIPKTYLFQGILCHVQVLERNVSPMVRTYDVRHAACLKVV